MRDEKKPLYRRENKRAWRHRSNDPGSEFRYERNTKAMNNFEGTHKAIKSTSGGQDYTPLYKFLLSKVGQPWDAVHSEAVSRLDTQEPIWYMVDLNADENSRAIINLGENSAYSALTVRDGILVKIDPNAEPMGRTCDCCTHTFNGVVQHKNSPYLKEQNERYRKIKAGKPVGTKEGINYDLLLKEKKTRAIQENESNFTA